MQSLPLLMALSAFPCFDDGWQFPSVKDLPMQTALPNPLIGLKGQVITNIGHWKDHRLPELKDLFQHYMYGRFPVPPAIAVRTLFADNTALGGKAIVSELRVGIYPVDDAPFHILLVTPANRPKAPIFLGLNFCGNHAVLDDERILIPTCWMYDRHPGVKNNRASAEGRGKQKDVWPVDMILDAGFGLATIYAGELEPDVKDVRGGLYQKVKPIGAPEEHWGRIAVWAWGLSRAIDALGGRPDVDSSRIAVVGHSRLGKTALLAGAYDDRIDLVIANQSGCGGAAPSRGTVGESVERINSAFPAWFNGNFKKFNDDPSRLPFDQHCLVAMCAPRPVLFTNAEEDTWANPKGQFDVLKAADPVYRLFGGGGLEGGFPKHGELPTGRLGYFIRPGKHSMTREDWKCYLHFAKRNMDP